MYILRIEADNMNKKIILKPTTNPLLLGRIFNTLIGIIFIVVGSINISLKAFDTYMIILNIILMLLGFYYFISGIFLLSPDSRYAPRIEMDEDGVLIKDDIFHRSKYFDWTGISEIKFGIYKFTIQLKSGKSQTFKLNFQQEAINEEIKSSFTETGRRNNIMITGI